MEVKTLAPGQRTSGVGIVGARKVKFEKHGNFEISKACHAVENLFLSQKALHSTSCTPSSRSIKSP